jgi:hypothetical protein
MDKRPNRAVPNGWTTNELASYFDKMRLNQLATFDIERLHFGLLTEIEAMYRRAVDSINHVEKGLFAVFLIRAHGSYLAACSLAAACHVPETYALLRLTLESAMYGLFMSKDNERFKLWLKRHDDEQARKNVRKLFTNAALLDTVENELPAMDGKRFRDLYEETVDRGAHPNERYLTPYMEQKRKAHGIDIKVTHMFEGGPRLQDIMVNTARTGLYGLLVFEHLYRARFALVSLDQDIYRLRDVLWPP